MNEEIPEELVPAIIAWAIWYFSYEFSNDFIDQVKKMYPELDSLTSRIDWTDCLFNVEYCDAVESADRLIQRMKPKYRERARTVYLEMLMYGV